MYSILTFYITFIIFIDLLTYRGLPQQLSGQCRICTVKEFAWQCKRCRFNPRVRKIPWRRKWQPIPIFLPGKCHGQRSRMGYSSPWSRKEWDMTQWLNNNIYKTVYVYIYNTHTHTHTHRVCVCIDLLIYLSFYLFGIYSKINIRGNVLEGLTQAPFYHSSSSKCSHCLSL